jgi:site-specific recombinase XerD
MIKSYLDYILYTRWLSRNTWIKEKKGLNKFECYLLSIWKTLEKPEYIKLIDILEFIAYLRKSWLVPWSCNAVLDGVKWIFRYMKNILELDVLDDKHIRYIKDPDKNIWYFNEKEKRLILNTVRKWVGKGSIVKLRNKLLTYMLLQTGLRCHELAKIKVNEIWENLQVVGKWGKLRTVYLRKELLEMIEEYLDKRKRKSDYLFDSTKEWHMREWSIRTIYNRISKKVWFHVHCHKFRHTFATDLLHIPWANVYNVAKLMGHSRITTTQIYLWVDDKELKNLQFSLNY